MKTTIVLAAIALVGLAFVGGNANAALVDQCEPLPNGLGTACVFVDVVVTGDCTSSCSITSDVRATVQ